MASSVLSTARLDRQINIKTCTHTHTFDGQPTAVTNSLTSKTLWIRTRLLTSFINGMGRIMWRLDINSLKCFHNFSHKFTDNSSVCDLNGIGGQQQQSIDQSITLSTSSKRTVTLHRSTVCLFWKREWKKICFARLKFRWKLRIIFCNEYIALVKHFVAGNN